MAEAKTLEELNREIAENEAEGKRLKAQRTALAAERFRGDLKDLESFEAMTPAQQIELRRADPDSWQRFMDLRRQRGEAELARRSAANQL